MLMCQYICFKKMLTNVLATHAVMAPHVQIQKGHILAHVLVVSPGIDVRMVSKYILYFYFKENNLKISVSNKV